MRQLDNSHSTDGRRLSVARRLLFLATLALATASCGNDDAPPAGWTTP